MIWESLEVESRVSATCTRTALRLGQSSRSNYSLRGQAVFSRALVKGRASTIVSRVQNKMYRYSRPLSLSRAAYCLGLHSDRKTRAPNILYVAGTALFLFLHKRAYCTEGRACTIQPSRQLQKMANGKSRVKASTAGLWHRR